MDRHQLGTDAVHDDEFMIPIISYGFIFLFANTLMKKNQGKNRETRKKTSAEPD
jgi:hypothetical protein